MNEKKYKIIIIVLIVICVISTGLCIYFGISNPSRTGEKLSLTVGQQLATIEDQRRTILELQDDLSAARESTERANDKAGQLERRIADDIRSAELTATRLAGLGADANGLVQRQRVLIEFFENFKRNHSQP